MGPGDEAMPVDARMVGGMLRSAALQVRRTICMVQAAQADQLPSEPADLLICEDPAPLCLLLCPVQMHATLYQTPVTPGSIPGVCRSAISEILQAGPTAACATVASQHSMHAKRYT